MATLVYSDVNGVDRSFSLGADPIMVGRAPECAIRSDDPRVSRIHARFYVEQGALWIEDLGSANGIYVGPTKVQRGPVPIGEIVLVGSIMIRLMPQSGTLPPPMGLHGTLAQWLEMERKARAAVEDERDAFVKRVGEMFEEVRTLREARGAHEMDAGGARDQLEQLRKSSAADLESMRLDLMKAREAKMIAETQAGITTAERLAESDMIISSLQHQLQEARAAAAVGDAQTKLLAEQVAVITARAEKAEKELAATQIRAQGAERNLAGANTMAAKAETRAADVDRKLADAEAARVQLEAELAAARERSAAGAAPAEAAAAQATKLAADLAAHTAQFEARRDRLAQPSLEQPTVVASIAAAEAPRAAARCRPRRATAAKTSSTPRGPSRTQAAIAALTTKLTAAEARTAELDARLRQAGGAEAEIAAARKAREDAREQVTGADKRIADAFVRADENEQRASAADTMAKAMAKDVAEALRRAVEADARARGVARELDGAHRRAEAAEKRDGERVAATREAETRVAAAEAKVLEIQAQLGGKLADAERELATRTESVEKVLNAKLEQVQRELAAERSTALALVDRKTQLERELTELRSAPAGAEARIQAAEARVSEYDVHVETLEDRIQDLESGMAVEQTASQSTLDDASAKVTKLEEQLGEAKAAAKTAVKTAANLEKRVDATETQLNAVKEARVAAETELAEARRRIVELEQVAGTSEADRARLEEVERRALEAEARIEPLAAKAEAADLAIGRASALQRQLDEALQKLSWIERDQAQHAQAANDVVAAETLAVTEARARDSELRARDAEGRAEALDAMVRDAEARVRDADVQAATANTHAAEVDARARDIEARAKDAAERIVDAERRARDTLAQLADVSARLEAAEAQVAEGGTSGIERQLARAQTRNALIKREVDAAENVRQFAANTEREIAQLERDLRETKAKLAQITLERDRMSAELRDIRDDSETTRQRAPIEPEVTAQADLSRYTALVARATELEQKLTAIEQEDDTLRRQLADAEARIAAQTRAQEDEPTGTGTPLPIEFAEHLNTLEESIDSLRSNMRAASDETAMMEQSDSVVAVSSAVSQAAEHVERARDALKTLVAMVANT